MWLQKLSEIHERQINGDLSYLNLRCDLHIAVYMIEALKNVIMFSYSDGKFTMEIKDIKSKKTKKIKDKKLFYWWQITRFKEIYEEEKELIRNFEEIKKKFNNLQSMMPKIEKDDPEIESKKKQIAELNKKLSAMAEYINSERIKLKQNLTLLSNFRNTCDTFESFKHLLNSIQLYLEYNK